MHIDARGYVSIVELIVYIPSGLIAFYVTSRHGFNRSSGWFYTVFLCVVRIAGAVCQLLEYNNQSAGLIKATVIIDSIGLSPLLLATLGLLSRLVDGINLMSVGETFTIKHFRIVQLLITLGLILSIAGGSSGGSSTDGSAPGEAPTSTTSKVGIILYIVSYVAIVAILLISLPNLTILPRKERRVGGAVLLALPFILVRLVYSALSVFVHDHYFNAVDGSVPIWVVMAVLMEFIVVFLFILLGFNLDKLEGGQAGPIANRPWKDNKGSRSPRSSSRPVAYQMTPQEPPLMYDNGARQQA